jgi:hypothetical protein
MGYPIGYIREILKNLAMTVPTPNEITAAAKVWKSQNAITKRWIIISFVLQIFFAFLQFEASHLSPN